jgi:hypothetical protein
MTLIEKIKILLNNYYIAKDGVYNLTHIEFLVFKAISSYLSFSTTKKPKPNTWHVYTVSTPLSSYRLTYCDNMKCTSFDIMQDIFREFHEVISADVINEYGGCRDVTFGTNNNKCIDVKHTVLDLELNKIKFVFIYENGYEFFFKITYHEEEIK